MECLIPYPGLLKRFIGSLSLASILLGSSVGFVQAESLVAIGEPAQSIVSSLLDDTAVIEIAASESLPDKATLKTLSQADLIVTAGGGRNPWLSLAGLSRRKLISLDAALDPESILSGEELTHSHGPGGEHTHGGVNPHYYMLPSYLLSMTEYVSGRLDGKKGIQLSKDAFESLKAQIDELDAMLTTVSPMLEERVVFAGDAFDYLDSHYQWKGVQSSFHFDAMPESWQKGELRGVLTGQQRTIILFSTPPLPALKELLEKEFGLTSYVLPSCYPAACEEDFLSMYKKSVALILKELSSSS